MPLCVVWFCASVDLVGAVSAVVCAMRLLYLVGAVAEVAVSAVAVVFRFCTSRFHFDLSWVSFSIADQSSFIDTSMQRSSVVGEL